MSYTCKELREGTRSFAELRELFIKRMTEDGKSQDRRRSDYNKAIFFYPEWCLKIPPNTRQAFDEITLEMVLECFDNAVRDWKKGW